MRRLLISGAVLVVVAGLTLTACAAEHQPPAAPASSTPDPTPTPAPLAEPPRRVAVACDELVPPAIRAQGVPGALVLDDGDPVEESWDAVVQQAGQTRCDWLLGEKSAIGLTIFPVDPETIGTWDDGPGAIIDTLGTDSAYNCRDYGDPAGVVNCSGHALVGDVRIELQATPPAGGDSTPWFGRMLAGVASIVEKAPPAPDWVAKPTVALGVFDDIPSALLEEVFGEVPPDANDFGGLTWRDGSAYTDAGMQWGSWGDQSAGTWVVAVEILPGGAWAAEALEAATRPESETGRLYEPATVPGLEHATIAVSDDAWSARGAYGTDLITVSVPRERFPERDAFIAVVGKFLAGLPRA